ncbi:MAG: UDP-galactopyranose mutase [Solirubrobacterales bacterium]
MAIINNNYDFIIAGSGFAGAVCARELAQRGGKKVLLVEKRDHIGGNAYDINDESGVLIHKYGPHIFHTNDKRAYDYLCRFTSWRDYMHEVAGSIYGNLIPIPFNLNSLHMVYDTEKAERLEKKLIDCYGIDKKVTILELMKNKDKELSELAEYVYNNVFLYYTQKQWGTSPDEIDPGVTARVPVFISRDNRYFQDLYQGIPSNGYTELFNNILNHENIDILLSTDINEILTFSTDSIMLNGEPYRGSVIYTGALDELFQCRYGRLPYRTLDFIFETYDMDWFQNYGTVNYTVDEPYTRITEFKHLSGQIMENKTTIVKEYSRAYTGAVDETPYYAVNNIENDSLYNKYKDLTSIYSNFYLIGRLAEYKYYNMDAIVSRSLELSDILVKTEGF